MLQKKLSIMQAADAANLVKVQLVRFLAEKVSKMNFIQEDCLWM